MIMHTYFHDVHNLNKDICNYCATLYWQKSESINLQILIASHKEVFTHKWW